MFLFSALQLLTLFTAFIFSLTHQIPTSLAKATANVNITERLFWSTQPEFTLLNLALSFMPNSLAPSTLLQLANLFIAFLSGRRNWLPNYLLYPLEIRCSPLSLPSTS
jgi:hypothetical protein